jgi:hypothetical protein
MHVTVLPLAIASRGGDRGAMHVTTSPLAIASREGEAMHVTAPKALGTRTVTAKSSRIHLFPY